MKKKKFITPKVRVIKLAAEELLAAGTTTKPSSVRLQGFTTAGYNESMFEPENEPEK